MALVKRVLGGDQAEIADIRDQHNVGADAVDDLDDYFELKVHGEAIPDTVRLQDSQVQRALTTDGYFYRAPGQPRRSAGSGIGLTIARGIARGHGGDVTAASPGRGHGSSFTLALPLRA
jgi:signal transduction histidine kinase